MHSSKKNTTATATSSKGKALIPRSWTLRKGGDASGEVTACVHGDGSLVMVVRLDGADWRTTENALSAILWRLSCDARAAGIPVLCP